MKPSETEVPVLDNEVDNPVEINSSDRSRQKLWLWLLLVLIAGGGFAIWRGFSPTVQTAKPASPQWG